MVSEKGRKKITVNLYFHIQERYTSKMKTNAFSCKQNLGECVAYIPALHEILIVRKFLRQRENYTR